MPACHSIQMTVVAKLSISEAISKFPPYPEYGSWWYNLGVLKRVYHRLDAQHISTKGAEKYGSTRWVLLGTRHSRRNHSGGRRAFFVLNLQIFLLAVLLYLLNEHVIKHMTQNLFFQGHFNDLLAMGLLLPYSNVLLSLYPHRDLRLLRPVPLFVFVLLIGLFWEYATPLYLSRSISDPLDVLAYVVGGVLYYGLITFKYKQISVQ